jgi:hypothetical protein
MCLPLFAFWVGRKNNGPIVERPRGGNINTRVVKLQHVRKDGNGSEEVIAGKRDVDLEPPATVQNP